MTKNRIFYAVALTLALGACSSSTKQVPVQDRRGTDVAQPAAPAASERAVAPVDLDQANLPGIGPKGIAHVIYFDYDSDQIKPEHRPIVEAHARFLVANKTRRLALEGHTDERGGREYNLALGQRRAEQVRKALTLLGAADGQIEAVSFGKERPSASGSDESSWSKNRRAEFNYR